MADGWRQHRPGVPAREKPWLNDPIVEGPRGAFDDLIPPNARPGLSRMSNEELLRGYQNARRREAIETIQFASILALVPPAFMLVLGSALVWAFKGFR